MNRLFCQSQRMKRNAVRFVSTTRRSPLETASLRLYRILLRQCRQLPQTLFLQPPLNPRDYGKSTLLSAADLVQENHSLALYQLFSNWLFLEAHASSSSLSDPKLFLQRKEASKNQMQQNWFQSISQWMQADNNDNHHHWMTSLWATQDDLKHAIQQAFRHSDDALSTTDRQGLAIRTSAMLREQEEIWEHTSVSRFASDTTCIRVLATSRCIGRTPTMSESSTDGTMSRRRFRFAYRIRIENCSTDHSVQLLGRTWYIQEIDDKWDSPFPHQDDHDDKEEKDTVRVDAPTTGAVGHLPVLHPGDAFEYMSGCELATKRGSMEGTFHMAIVPRTTPSGRVGDQVAALFSDHKLQVPVEPFPLVTSDA